MSAILELQSAAVSREKSNQRYCEEYIHAINVSVNSGLTSITVTLNRSPFRDDLLELLKTKGYTIIKNNTSSDNPIYDYYTISWV
jgi:hypothetical protein